MDAERIMEKSWKIEDTTSQYSQLKSIASSRTDTSSAVGKKKLTANINYEFSQRQKDDLKTAFDLLDPNGTGRIELKELKVAFRALGYEPTKSELSDLMLEVDKDNTGHLSFSDFVHLMKKKMFARETEQNLMKSFNLMDENRSGKITLDNLRQVAVELGENINEEELREMISVADMAGNGEVGPIDFIAIMTKYYD